MTRVDVAALSLRILALYVWLETGLSFSDLAHRLADGQHRFQRDPTEIVGWLLSVLLLVMFGCALFVRAPAIARSIFPSSEPIQSATRPEIGALALRICGLLVIAHFIQDLGFVPAYTKYSAAHPGWSYADARLVTIAFTGVTGVGLFWWAPRLSRSLFGSPLNPLDATLLAHVQAVSFSVLGVYLIVNALSPLVQYVVESVYTEEYALDLKAWSHGAVALLGLALLIGGRGLSRFWNWLHRAGLSLRPEQHG